mmetsp:Transcript_5858/g.5291  ORF Transcript_5858/g.5291 Transcript_5858/m.5291 type:complete len:193 (+) Transcript_5858:18-596(+)|eukprot:CAMPEP_0170554670 /NCGR_PEP_ID=MMETSP0211-20121228/12548_1 /TAXON_ID=311385 /ORGANISM="Pseudokeronopsis sp., Strain OXSARD2" /LENGTH=192 /DNA_ID=CAMNT_0010863929 /DNA_START=309 /DNA_END=887 /DNA_ORIENTATION=+
MDYRRDLRDLAGITPKDKPVRGSYAEERLAELKEERDKFNVNFLGYYKGGVPQKDRGTLRGKAIGNPNDFHQPALHNFLEYDHQDTTLIGSKEAMEFKHWMNTDQADHARSYPYYPMYYDRNFEFLKDRMYWWNLIVIICLVGYTKSKYEVEKDRWAQWKRKEHIQDLPAHHFSNRGGILLEKQFVGFEKYY